MVKYTRKRSTYSKRKTLRRSRRMYNIAKPRRLLKYTPTVAFKRTIYWGSWTPNTTTINGYWRYENLNIGTLANWTEYANLFDQYRINAIKVVFRPKYDSFAGNDTTDTTLPGITNQAGTMVHVINDPESNITPSGTYTSATLNSFLENGNVRTHMGNKPFSVFFKPRIENAVTSGTPRVKAPWLQTKDNTIPHYGYHVFMQDINMTGNFGQTFDLFVTYYFQCRGMK